MTRLALLLCLASCGGKLAYEQPVYDGGPLYCCQVSGTEAICDGTAQYTLTCLGSCAPHKLCAVQAQDGGIVGVGNVGVIP